MIAVKVLLLINAPPDFTITLIAAVLANTGVAAIRLAVLPALSIPPVKFTFNEWVPLAWAFVPKLSNRELAARVPQAFKFTVRLSVPISVVKSHVANETRKFSLKAAGT